MLLGLPPARTLDEPEKYNIQGIQIHAWTKQQMELAGAT